MSNKLINKLKFYLAMSAVKFLSLNAMDKIMRTATGLRIADSAKEVLAEVLEAKGTEISRKAKTFAEHAGRKTITDKDITLATR